MYKSNDQTTRKLDSDFSIYNKKLTYPEVAKLCTRKTKEKVKPILIKFPLILYEKKSREPL